LSLPRRRVLHGYTYRWDWIQFTLDYSETLPNSPTNCYNKNLIVTVMYSLQIVHTQTL